MKRTSLCLAAGAAALLLLVNCQKVIKPDPVPTQDLMTGAWKVVAAYDEYDSSILNQISVPVAALSFQGLDAFISTAGPMAMYIVYGGSQYVKIASTIDQVFDYAKLYNNELQFNVGDWIIGDGVVDRFTMRFRLQGLPGQNSLETLLSLMGIGSQWMNTTIYHQFNNVCVEISENSSDTMRLFFDDSTTASYYTINSNMDKVPWLGFQAPFNRCYFVFVRQTVGLDSLVRTVVTPHN